MRVFSYIVARDFGFAPNPFGGCCSLATCKPVIRAKATLGDWVVGTGAKGRYNLAGYLLYAMQIDEVLDFSSYWCDARFTCKRPVLNGSLKQLYGDNIYHLEGKHWIQSDSHHSELNGKPNVGNVKRDTSADRVLIARRFVYFGANAVRIPRRFRAFAKSGEDLCCFTQGHRRLSAEFAAALELWLSDLGKWGVQGLPLEFARHSRATQ